MYIPGKEEKKKKKKEAHWDSRKRRQRQRQRARALPNIFRGSTPLVTLPVMPSILHACPCTVMVQ